MKKNEFVSLVAERTDMSKKDTEKVIDAAGKVTLESGSGAAFAAVDGKVTSASTKSEAKRS